MTVPDRVAWAVAHVGPAPDAHVLEVGTGPGASAEVLCPLLTTGRLVAVDRSATAVRRTGDRNAAHVDAGRLEVRQASMHDTGLPDASVDHAFCVNVNAFWTGPATAETAELRRVLRPGGRLHVVYGGGGPTPSPRVVAQVREALARGGFADVQVTPGDVAFAVCGRPA